MTNWKSSVSPFSKFKSESFSKYGKAGKFIYYLGESDLLRKSSKEVPVNLIKSKTYQQKFTYLKKCLVSYRKITGVGRAITAVQIGVAERFAVILAPKKLLLIINPKITRISKDKLLYPEMCMSVVPVIAPVIRPAWIEFEYHDANGELKKWKTKGSSKQGKILNRVFQHEIDHMNGIINIDLVQKPSDLFLLSDPKFYKTAKFEKVK